MITLKKLKVIPTDGGNVFHALKNSEKMIYNFGEVYFSSINYKTIRAWKLHTKMTLNLIVPIGMVKFVFYFEKTNKFLEYIIGEENYCRLTVAPNIWFGFQGVATTPSLLLNLACIPHDLTEVKRVKLSEVEFNWQSER
mgnify:CR=1 FL=1